MAAFERQPRTLAHETSEFEFRHFVRQHFDSPPASCGVVANAEGTSGANVRRFTLQVKDRLRKDWDRRWLVTFYLAATSGGDPSAAGNTVAIVTGVTSRVVLANAWYEVLTDASGLVVFDVTIAGAASRFVVAGVGGWFDEFGGTSGFAWT